MFLLIPAQQHEYRIRSVLHIALVLVHAVSCDGAYGLYVVTFRDRLGRTPH